MLRPRPFTSVQTCFHVKIIEPIKSHPFLEKSAWRPSVGSSGSPQRKKYRRRCCFNPSGFELATTTPSSRPKVTERIHSLWLEVKKRVNCLSVQSTLVKSSHFFWCRSSALSVFSAGTILLPSGQRWSLNGGQKKKRPHWSVVITSNWQVCY